MRTFCSCVSTHSANVENPSLAGGHNEYDLNSLIGDTRPSRARRERCIQLAPLIKK